MHATDIVAYTYQAETLCPDCIMAKFNFDGRLGDDLERVLNWCASVTGLDRQDESSFDSSEFPKVVFADHIVWREYQDEHGCVAGEGPEHCDSCDAELL